VRTKNQFSKQNIRPQSSKEPPLLSPNTQEKQEQKKFKAIYIQHPLKRITTTKIKNEKITHHERRDYHSATDPQQTRHNPCEYADS